MSRASAVAAARRTEDSRVAFVEHSSLLLLLLILGMCFHSIPIRFEHSLHANLLPCDSPLNEAVSNSQQWRYTVGERERERESTCAGNLVGSQQLWNLFCSIQSFAFTFPFHPQSDTQPACKAAAVRSVLGTSIFIGLLWDHHHHQTSDIESPNWGAEALN